MIPRAGSQTKFISHESPWRWARPSSAVRFPPARCASKRRRRASLCRSPEPHSGSCEAISATARPLGRGLLRAARTARAASARGLLYRPVDRRADGALGARAGRAGRYRSGVRERPLCAARSSAGSPGARRSRRCRSDRYVADASEPRGAARDACNRAQRRLHDRTTSGLRRQACGFHRKSAVRPSPCFVFANQSACAPHGEGARLRRIGSGRAARVVLSRDRGEGSHR